MGTTPTLALPYPEPSDPADVPTDIHELATALDTLVHKVTYGTTPPATPNDGDEWILPADAAAGVMWRFRWNAASGSSYKWEFVGGAPMYAEVATAEAVAVGASYVDLTTVGPQITVARAGDYLLRWGAYVALGATAGSQLYCVPKIGAATANDNDAAGLAVAAAGTNASNVWREMRRTVATAATLIKLQYRSVVSSGSAGERMLLILPVRVS